jgi:cyclic-di-GMP phosphodiesterase TipF (flagellum assembly factor)
VTDILISAASALISAAAGWGLYQYGFANINMAGAAAAFLFFFALHLRGSLSRAQLAREVEEDMNDLRAANRSMKEALDDANRKMNDAAAALSKKTDAQERKMVGELKLIERLVRQSATIAAKRRAETIAAPALLAAPTAALPAVPPALPAARAPLPAPAPNQGIADPRMLEMIRRALEENRVDLYLQPVVGLPQRKVRYYEALSRLRSEDGGIIMPAQYIKVAAPAGLMSVVDNLLLFRCVQIVRRLTQKTRDIGVFCNISGHTLADQEFFPQFLEFMHHNRDLAGQIVFEFNQAAVMAAGSAEAANLRYLSNLGFRLSMDQVTQLDLDFARVRQLGFQFLKLRVSTLLAGMEEARAEVAAEDFKDLLSRNGLKLIVERVEHERTVVQLLEYNVELAQGYLFGEPRPIREVGDAHDPRAPAAPAANTGSLPRGLARRLAG